MPISRNPWVPGHLIVMFAGNLSDEECRRVISEQGHEVINNTPILNLYLVAVPEGREREQADRYGRLPGVRTAAPNHIAKLHNE